MGAPGTAPPTGLDGLLALLGRAPGRALWPGICGRPKGRDGTFTGCEVGGYDTGGRADDTGCGGPEAGRLYDAVGAGRGALTGGALVFCRAILARASRMEEPLGAGGAGAAGGAVGWPWNEASTLGGGLPGGVVDSSAASQWLDGISSQAAQQQRQGADPDVLPSEEQRTLWWCIELFLERLNHLHGERLSLLPDIKKLLNLFLHAARYVSYDPNKTRRYETK